MAEIYEQGNEMQYSRALLLCALNRCDCGNSLTLIYDDLHEKSGELKCSTCGKSHGRFHKTEKKKHVSERQKSANSSAPV